MSSLLATMAILRAHWNQQRDYWTNFEPFVADCLKAWPDGKSVKPNLLRDALVDKFSIPIIPINTAQLLRDRAHKDGLLSRNNLTRAYHPNRAKLDALPDLEAASKTALANMKDLCSRLMSYVSENYELEWTEADAERALEAFVGEFSVELAMARREGGLNSRPKTEKNEALTAVHAFARNAIERDQSTLELLETMVRGSMLANVLYFTGLGSWAPSFQNLVAYLDTTPVIRMLGLAPDALSEAAQEMLSLMKEFSITPRVFEHTVTEIQGVLSGVEHGLRRVRSGRTDFEQLGKINREVVDHLLSQGAGPADVEEVIADLERRLLELGIQVEERPDRLERPDYDEARLDEMLQDRIHYRSAGPRQKDIDSILAVHILREGRECRDLTKASAVFVTANEKLARVSQAYFKEDNSQDRFHTASLTFHLQRSFGFDDLMNCQASPELF